MKSLLDYKIKDLSLIIGGKREVSWVDMDGDGDLDKVVRIVRGGLVRRITIHFR